MPRQKPADAQAKPPDAQAKPADAQVKPPGAQAKPADTLTTSAARVKLKIDWLSFS